VAPCAKQHISHGPRRSVAGQFHYDGVVSGVLSINGGSSSIRFAVYDHGNIHVRGHKEEGTITTPFDMTVLNDLDPYGEDLPEIRNWTWNA
jgi:phosphoketolase